MVDKNLFIYDLAVAAIFKDEGKYLKEWLDYHLLAGVDHFFLYNNDSTDDYEKVLAPYVEKKLVTLINFSGKGMQTPAYDNAIERFRFFCRYMTFIDLDEFIFPKNNQSISEVVDEILFQDEQAAALGINWQCFGSNGQKTADYSRGVLERFTRRAQDNWIAVEGKNYAGNIYIKTVMNPRWYDYFIGPHYATYFQNLKSINADGRRTYMAGSHPISTDKIVINHYYTKSKEEFFKKKMTRGWACSGEVPYDEKNFKVCDRNEVFDDGILKYRAARAENFSLESYDERIRRAEKVLIKILTQRSPFDAPPEFFIGKLETFLTCRALAEKLGTKIGSKTAEEYALVWIYQTLNKNRVLTYAELQLFVNALPEILARPFPLAKKIVREFSARVLPAMMNAAKDFQTWKVYKNLTLLQRLLNSI